jgi:hypothetical protein
MNIFVLIIYRLTTYSLRDTATAEQLWYDALLTKLTSSLAVKVPFRLRKLLLIQ